MSNKINFLFRCFTLTSFERTSSSCVHCSNERIETGSSGGSDNSKWPLWVPRVGPGRTGVLGRWFTRVPKIPGSVTRRIFPPKFSSGASRLPRGFRLRAEEQREREGKGLLLPTTPLERANSNNNVLGVDGTQQGFQLMKIQTEYGK